MPRKVADITAQLEAAPAIAEDAALLEALLVAYRARPLPGLIELIALVGKRASIEHPTTGSLDDQHARWLEIAARQRAVDLEWLIANTITGRTEYSMERLAKLERWPVDPRFASRLLALAEGRRMTTKAFWRDAFRFLGKQVHPGLAPILAPMLDLVPTTVFERSLLKKLRTLEAKLQALVPLSPSSTERAAIEALARRLDVTAHRTAEKTAEDFLREIWAAPNDDGPREVFADWLQERGDPRGELIALQLTRARERERLRQTPPSSQGMVLRLMAGDELRAYRREAALLKKHGREWSAPFEAVLSHPKSRFDRGFLGTAVVHWRKLASVPSLMTHPAWATVRSFELDHDGDRACDAWLDHMIALGAKRA